MTITIMRGGSGKWTHRYSGKTIASGHVPKTAPFVQVCTRQFLRQCDDPLIGHQKSLGGGHLVEVEIPKAAYERLISQWEAYWERRKNQKADSARKIKALREKLGLSHEEFSDRIGGFCSGSRIELLETGADPSPSESTSIEIMESEIRSKV